MNNIQDAVKEVLTIICIAWAVQENMFVILNACLAETYGIGAVKPVSKSMFTKITKLDSQTGLQSYSLNAMNTENTFFRWPDKTHELRFEPRNRWTVFN